MTIQSQVMNDSVRDVSGRSPIPGYSSAHKCTVPIGNIVGLYRSTFPKPFRGTFPPCAMGGEKGATCQLPNKPSSGAPLTFWVRDFTG